MEKGLLIKQYEIAVNAAIQVTTWRQNANTFYLAINSAILPVTIYLYNTSFLVAFILSVIGIGVSILWFVSIEYFRRLNGIKFALIHKMEEKLPYKIFKEEWNKHKKMQMLSVSQIEKFIPVLFIFAFVILLIIKSI